MLKRLTILLLCFVHFISSAQNNINELEYFIDNDPGIGNATAVTITPGQTLDLSVNVDLSAITDGIHFIYFRAMNDSGWGQTYYQPFILDNNATNQSIINITDLEYFFDADPGYGNATAITISPAEALSINDNLDLTGLSDGIHILHLRAKDQNGIWGTTYAQPIIMLGASISSTVNAIEYFVDTDPGYGNATSVGITPASVIDHSFIVDLTGLNPGMHMFHVRAQNSNGLWSEVYAIPFLSLGNNTMSNVQYVEYYFDNDPGYGNASSLSITPGQTLINSYNLDLSGLTPGIHMVTVRAQNDNGFWGINYTQPFLMLGTNEGQIDYIEFHVDSFAGFGNGTTIAITPGNVIDTALVVPLDAGITAENHDIYVVARDNNGAWSFLAQTIFCVGAQASFTTDTACFKDLTTFISTSQNTNGNTTYSWDVNNDGVTDYNAMTITHNFGATGTFPVTLILDKDSLCPDSFAANVHVDSIGSISGNVFNTSGSITSGHVKLYQYKASGIMPLVDSVQIDASGNYAFTDLLADDYLIKAHPDTSVYPNTVATYLDSTISWSKAYVINSLCDTVINIGLLDISLVTGSGTISGYIFTVDTLNRAGDPIPGIDIALEQIPGGIIAKDTETDDNGFYKFEALPANTYRINVDIPGALMDSTYEISINNSDTVFENLNFVFDSTSIYIDQVSGIRDVYRADNYNIAVYPNPFNNYINIDLSLNDGTHQCKMVIYDMLGKEIVTPLNSTHSTGLFRYQFRPKDYDLGAGIYLINLQIDGYSETIRIIQTQ